MSPVSLRTSVRIAGRGRAGGSLAGALRSVGWDVELVAHDDASADGVDLLVLAVPDGAISSVAAAIDPVETTVVAHLAGSVGLDALAPHERRAALHPLVALPNADLGADRLRGAWFATAGDPLVQRVVAALGGRQFAVDDVHRAPYHAAAVIASNHLVALLAQAQRVGTAAGVPFDAYLDLVRATVENVAALGPKGALTGPAARGDTVTIQRHLDALPEDERPMYALLADACRRLAAEP
jgi:predicted short-subunit dehydrogenase-like oxidoreductase (DUF2520 family)